MDHFADRLVAALREKHNPVCVGLDPRWPSLPLEIRRRHDDGTLAGMARGFEEFCCRVLDVVAPLVPVVKPQSAFFEACGPAGLLALQAVLARARRLGLVSILDGKRNDIAATAAAYADAAFAGTPVGDTVEPVWNADALTVNPYLGRDAVEPFVKSARGSGRGVFVLVRTSNPGAGQFQDLVCEGQPLYQHVARAVSAWAQECQGKCGYGDVAAVVGATYPAELSVLRHLMPNVFFLLPGYGAQGATAVDAAPAFQADGLGALVNSSRGILFCYPPEARDWEQSVQAATRAMIADLAQHTSSGRLA